MVPGRLETACVLNIEEYTQYVQSVRGLPAFRQNQWVNRPGGLLIVSKTGAVMASCRLRQAPLLGKAPTAPLGKGCTIFGKHFVRSATHQQPKRYLRPFYLSTFSSFLRADNLSTANINE